MSKTPTHAEKALRVAKGRGIARARDFRAAGIPATYLARLTATGQLVRLGRGLYRHADFAEHHTAHDLAEAARRVPHGIVSLLSALRVHGLTTQLPRSIWLTLSSKARAPKNMPVHCEIVRASEPMLSAGRTTVSIEGVDVPITNVAKTVVDCFKYRRRVGADVALEALRDALGQRKTTRKELWHYAGICRVRAVMRPYLEALT